MIKIILQVVSNWAAIITQRVFGNLQFWEMRIILCCSLTKFWVFETSCAPAFWASILESRYLFLPASLTLTDIVCDRSQTSFCVCMFEGYDGGSSDSDCESPILDEQEAQPPQMPDFWLIAQIHQDRVKVYSHSRLEPILSASVTVCFCWDM